MSLPTLRFTHRFENGMEATIRVERRECSVPKVTASHPQLDISGIEREFQMWRQYVEDSLIDGGTLSEGEVTAIALNAAKGLI